MFWQLATFVISLLGIVAALSLLNYPPPPPQETNMYAPPPTNPYLEAVAATGLVEAFGENVLIGVPVQALVQEVHVKVGDQVKKDDLLIQLDNRTELSQVEVQKKNVEVAKANLGKNISQLGRLTSVKDERAVSLEDLRNKQYDVSVATEQLAQAEATLQDAETNLALTRIISPKDGIILRCDLRSGEFANFIPIDPVDSTTPAIVLGRAAPLQIRADIDEQNAYRIKPDQEAIAYTRGTLLVALPLKFVRIEPFCIPKRNLSSVVDERIDTRVLQVIYTFEPIENYPVYVGQQVDIFIKAPVTEQKLKG